MMELTKYSTYEGWSASSRVYCSRESIKEIIQNENTILLLKLTRNSSENYSRVEKNKQSTTRLTLLLAEYLSRA